MADLVGGIAQFPGKNNLIFGSPDADYIFGDPFTEGNIEGTLPPNAGRLSSGTGGNDRLYGLGGGDIIVGDAGLIDGTGRGGNDFIDGGDGDDPFLIGDADAEMSGNAKGGNDRIHGGIGFDGLYGDSGSQMFGDLRGGNDELDGGEGGDTLAGDSIAMGGNAHGGNDRLDGGAGIDQLYGDASQLMTGEARGGNDLLFGGDGGDFIYGDARAVNSFDLRPVFDFFSLATDVRGGMDLLVGGAGNDRLWGDFREVTGNAPAVFSGGADRFVFENGSGLDTIFDFQDDVDLIDLTGFAGITGFGNLSPANVAPSGADTVIDLGAAAGGAGGPAVLTLAGFTAANLDATDFLFA